MNHTYQIQGMTCNGCKTHVEETLSKVDGVSRVSVDLQKAEAVKTETTRLCVYPKYVQRITGKSERWGPSGPQLQN